MANADFLVRDAIKKVWQTPKQDNQSIIKPERITYQGGVWNTYELGWETITMPEVSTRFHLYQVGQVTPAFLNLFNTKGKWVSLSDACIAGKTICDIYVGSGVQLPRSTTYYYVTKSKALLIAVKRHNSINFSFDNDAVYLRSYDNAFFASVRADAQANSIDVQGGIMKTSDDIMSLVNKYAAKLSMPGGVYCFINGYKRPGISLSTVRVGDVAEFVYDSSIKRVVDFKISTLQTFDSNLDLKAKYVLHYTGIEENTVDYFDDVDLFIVDIATQKGVYVHRNARDTLRMLTHRDYSIPVAYLVPYFNHFLDANGGYVLDNLYLRMHVRKSGYQRALVYEANRIDDLYKLSQVNVAGAMTGVDSTVSIWTANALEQCKYVEIMGSDCCDITNEMVTDAYGYHAVSKLIGDTPVRVNRSDPLRAVEVPHLLQYDCQIFEYDQQGLLLGNHRHTAGKLYGYRDDNCYYAEMIAGEGTTLLDEVYGSDPVPIDPLGSYRFYACSIVDDLPDGDWVDITGTSAYTKTSNLVTWFADPTKYFMLRSDRKFLLSSRSLMMNQGVLSYALASRQTRAGVTAVRNMEVPMGELDVWLNGHQLIEGLDFVVKFPQITIVSKKYLVNPLTQPQQIVHRFTGFCDNQFKRTPKREFGFAQHGKVSQNDRYQIHEGKVMKLIAGGRMYMADELNFVEDDSAGNLLANGTPYQISDIVVPMRGVTYMETYAYRQLALDIDEEIEDYLSLKIDENESTAVNPISQRYPLYSPFIAKIIELIVADIITDPALSGLYSDEKVRELCAPYEYLLTYDPTHIDNHLSDDYVIIHPHYSDNVIGLDIQRYKFLAKVVRIYSNGKINLSSFIQVVPT